MIDSENLNEKVGQVANTPYEENVDQAQPATPTQSDDVVKGKVVRIDTDGVNIELEDGNIGVVPISHFNKEEVSLDDIVELRLQERNGQKTILNIVSHVKAGSQQPAEAEHPQDDAPEELELESGDIQAKVTKVEKKGDKTIVTLETLGDKKIMITDSEELRLHVDVEVGYVLNLELDRNVIKAAQIHSKPVIEATPNDDNSEVEDADAEEVTENEEEEDEIRLDYIDKDFLLECMSVPTHSKLEFRMVAFVIMWARRNKVKYEFDSYGNVYLTKGELDEGEYYPCVTSHLDTVQTKHDPYIYAGVPLQLKIEKDKNKQHKLSVNNEDGTLGSDIGIGADCKSGICICLALFEHMEKLKACFFLDEETGCNGSDHLDENWFKDVGYVIGFDSPDLYRAAWSCQGTKLFNYDFYEKHMKEVCDTWGLTEGCFFSEPYTDVKNIREKIGVICMNFGNGGYNAHNIGGTEYCIMEDMDQACGMGIDLIDAIGCTRHYLKHTGKTWGTSTNYSYTRHNDGTYQRNNDEEEDNRKLELLGDKSRRSYASSSSSSNSSSSSSSSSSSTTKPTVSKEDEIKFETVKYIADRYDGHIKAIKEEVLEGIKAVCEANGLAYKPFEEVITAKFSNEIKF